MTISKLWFLAIFLVFSAENAFADAIKVQKVINGKTLILENGILVRLASLQVPNIHELTGKKRPGEPLGEEAAQTLRQLVEGKKVSLLPDPPQMDRHGRRLAFLTLADGRSVQEEMLKAGMALVYPFADQRDKAKELLAAEKEARAAQRGIWADAYWEPADAASIRVPRERYQLVRGIISKVAGAGGNWYLNFGKDYKTDFTAFIKGSDYRKYFKNYNLMDLQGKQVLLRGWVYRRDGAAMDVVLPEQIEAGQ